MGRRVFGIAWVILFLLSGAWAMATPISASPDEPAHLVKAASVVRGQFVGEPSDIGHVVQVPQYVASTQALTCFAFQPDVPASCVPEVAGNPWQTVNGTTTAGLYNPVYYVLVGWPSLAIQNDVGVYAMRLMNALVCSLFLAVSAGLIARWRRPGMAALGFAAAITPMVLFLNATVNPNSLEITTILAVFVGMLGITLHPRRDLLATRATVVMIAGAIAVNTRGLAPLWLLVAIAAPLLLVSGRQLGELARSRIVQAAAAVVAVATAAAIVWLLTSSSLTAGVDDPSETLAPPSVGESAVTGFIAALERTFRLGGSIVGYFGWLDTPAPLAVYFVWAMFVGTLALLAFVLLRGRRFALAASVVAIVVLVPPLIQGAYITGGGFIWQGRYTLPAFVCAVVVLAALLSERLLLERSILRRLALAVAVLWAGAQWYSFMTALKRYGVGIEGTWVELLLRPDWAPPGGNLLWAVVSLAVIAAAGVLLYRWATAPVVTDHVEPTRRAASAGAVRPARR